MEFTGKAIYHHFAHVHALLDLTAEGMMRKVDLPVTDIEYG
jgi:hypothetical protein